MVFFSKQCSLIPNNSFIPVNVNYITDILATFSAKDFGKIIQNLDLEKSFKILIQTKPMYMITSIHMLKICGDSIYVPLEMIFK